MAAVILLDQVGLPAGSPGFARTDGLNTGAKVTVQSVGAATTHEARLLTFPESDDTVAGSWTQTNPTTWEFSPKAGIDGCYRVEIVTDRGLASQARTVKVFGIRDANGYLFPSFGLLADLMANRPDLSDPAKLVEYIKASELNEPNATFPAGYPFGWHREVDAILRGLVAGGGGGGYLGPNVGAELWSWNKTDISQFGATPLRFGPDSGVAPAGSAALSVDTSFDVRGKPMLKVQGTSHNGGSVFPILGLTLPEHFWFYWRLATAGPALTCGGAVVPFGIESPTYAGFLLGLVNFPSYAGSVNSAHLITTDYALGSSTIIRSSGITHDLNRATTVQPLPTPNDIAMIGGFEGLIQCKRQIGANPTADWIDRVSYRWSHGSGGQGFVMQQQMRRANCAGAADPSPSWDGLDMETAYVGLFQNNQTSDYVGYLDLRIYEYNETPGD